MLDGCGRTINYLRLSVTDLCNYRCRYCMPPEGVAKRDHGDILSLEELADIAFKDAPKSDGSYYLEGVLSRKKQLIPAFMRAINLM